MENAWKGIAILGIWVGIGMVALHAPVALPVAVMCAMFATVVIAAS